MPSRPTPVRRLLLLPLCLAGVLVPAPAHALDCVGHPGLTTAGLVDGTAAAYDGSRLLDGFDGVLLGRAVAVPGRSEGEPAEVVLEVLLADRPLPAKVVVTGSGPGWTTWQPFDEGAVYVVPYGQSVGVLRSELCDPVRDVPEDELDALTALARAQGWTAPAQDALPTGDPVPTATPTASSSGTSLGTAAPLAGGAAALGAAAAAVLRRRRRAA